MSEQPGSPSDRLPPRVEAYPQARVRRGWWPGWIWSIPVAVLIVVGWLGMRYLIAGGEDITISFADAHGVKKNNTNIEYRGTIVGQVSSVELDTAGDAVLVHASIDQRAAKFLRTGTRFWLRGANPSLGNLSSLGAVLSGPTIMMDPGPGKRTKQFTGSARKPLETAAHVEPLLYAVSLKGDAGSLKNGDPVQLDGFTVGEVRQVGFEYDPSTDELFMPCTIALYPAHLFHIRGMQGMASTKALSTALASLVAHGLRARLDRDPPLVGAARLGLAMIPGAPQQQAAILEGLPEIPFDAGGGLESIVTRVNKVPLEQIAHNLLDITHHIDTLVSSPQLKQSISRLDQALGQIRTLAKQAGPQVTALAGSLRKTADELDRTAGSADGLINGNATQDGVGATLEEIREAARSVRSLANYLDRHPDALLTGRMDRR